eukprot:11216735-Ditylum_brightwellii.AAC.1
MESISTLPVLFDDVYGKDGMHGVDYLFDIGGLPLTREYEGITLGWSACSYSMKSVTYTGARPDEKWRL